MSEKAKTIKVKCKGNKSMITINGVHMVRNVVDEHPIGVVWFSILMNATCDAGGDLGHVFSMITMVNACLDINQRIGAPINTPQKVSGSRLA